jgi:hypothetical protein
MYTDYSNAITTGISFEMGGGDAGCGGIPRTAKVCLHYFPTNIYYILTFLHSHILTFSHSYILTFLHSYILTFSHSYILTLCHSHIFTFLHYKIFFNCNPAASTAPLIHDVDEPERCSYIIVMSSIIACPPNLSPSAIQPYYDGSNTQVLQESGLWAKPEDQMKEKKFSCSLLKSSTNCDRHYGCRRNVARMWVIRGCVGEFICWGSKVVCGGTSLITECDC